jgi:hypothetical protein
MFATNRLFSWFAGAYAHDKFIKNVDTLFNKNNINHLAWIIHESRLV